ncbi:MAG: LacI family DNA-binding transcriptional regulator [Actinomycetaceae bacterium]|nr:LacI family DNA-binding transcriptional regulator [Actinomycetaceae bacterium]
MATRADVARLAGVSPSTVSYVFSGDRPIKEETRKKVLEAARELDYVPNAFAANLAARKMRTIGIVLRIESSGMDRTTADYVTGMLKRSTERGLMLLLPAGVSENEETFRRFLRSRLLDGVLYMEVAQDDWREDILLAEKVPAVALGFSGRTDGVPFVETDFAALGRIVVDEFVKRGHTHALFLGRESHSRAHLDRTIGESRNAMQVRARELRVRVDEMILPEYFLAAREVLPRLRDREGAPTVLVAENMPVAEGVIALAAAEGIELGRDFSMVTLGNQIGYTAETAFELSEVATDRIRMGEMCVDMLAQVYSGMDSGAKPESVMFEPEFVDRGSLVQRA